MKTQWIAISTDAFREELCKNMQPMTLLSKPVSVLHLGFHAGLVLFGQASAVAYASVIAPMRKSLMGVVSQVVVISGWPFGM